MTAAAFTLRTTGSGRAGEPVLLTVTGELDTTNTAEFARQVAGALGDRPAVVDVSALHYIDSAGFSALHRLHATRRVAVLIRPDSHLRRSATVIGLPYHSDPEAAARLVRPGAG